MKRFLPFLICSAALAQDLDADFSVIRELQQRERKALEQIVESQIKNYKGRPEEALSVQVADILSSPVYPGHINKGALLVNLLTNQQEYLTEPIYVDVYSKADASGYHYLRGANGKVVYKTLATNVANIAQVSNLREPPHRYEPIERKEVDLSRDKEFYFSTEFNLRLGLTKPRFTRDLVDDQAGHTGKTVQYEAQVYDDFNLPFEAGAMVALETVAGSGGESRYSTSFFSIGPLVKFELFKFYDRPVLATVAARTSLYGRFTESSPADSRSFRINQTTLFLGAQQNFDFFFGEIVAGLGFQRQWMKASSGQSNAGLGSNSEFDDSFSFSVGHKWDWK